jgi:hypothetical protein
MLLSLALLSLLAGATLLLVSLYLWQNRAHYLAQNLHRLLPGTTSTLGSLEVTPNELTLTDLTLIDAETQQPLASLRSASLSAYWETLRHQTVGQLNIDGLHLTTTAERLPQLLAQLRPPARAPRSPAEPPPGRAFSLAGLNLTDLQVHLIGDARTPTIHFTLDHQLEALQISAEGVPSLDSTRLTLRDLDITTPDGSHLVLPRLTLEVSFDPANGLIEVHDFQIPTLELTLYPALGQALQALVSKDSSQKSAPPAWLQGLIIHRSALDSLRLTAREGLPSDLGLPTISVETQVTYRSENLSWTVADGWTRPGTHHLKLTDTAIAPLESASGHLRAPSLLLDLRYHPSSGHWQVDNLTAEGKPSLDWTQALEDALFPPPPKASPAAHPPAKEAPPATAPEWVITKFNLSDLQLKLQQTRLMPLPLSGLLTLHSQDLHFIDSKLTSSKPQRLLFTHIETLIPGSRTAEVTRIDSIEVSLRPDALAASGLIDRLHIIHPRLSYHLDLNAVADGAPPPTPITPPAPYALPPPLDQLHFNHLAITDGEVRVAGKWGAPFTAETSFSVTTLESPASSATPSSLHTLSIAATRLIATDNTPLPVAQVGQFQVTARLPELLTERRLESLSLDGGQVAFGEALIAILDPGKTPSAPKPPQQPASPTAAARVQVPYAPPKKWTAGQVSINDLSITLQKIAPGLPPLTFAVQFQAKDTPLEPEGLVENVEAQRIELTSLTIPAPYGSLRPVARLDTIFIHFTLDGLLRQRIQRVEILNPTLYIGEPLFWYVDYYRKFAAGEIRPGLEKMALASAANDIALNAVSQALSTAAIPAKSWGIDELAVHGGKLILAPKGVPLPGFRQPFPFSFSTRLESGQLDAVFDIPSDNYPLPDIDLEFIGMKGQVRFNLPLRDVDNNLTETFEVDQIRWKQLHIENAHLSVTYDMNGIYGKFGGEAYEGYIEGGFDVYLNDAYTWDGWIAATDVLTTEITQKLTPAYFLLEGKVRGSLIAAGDSKELYQADITCSNATSGRFSIAALNDMLDTLPPKVSATLTDQITRIGLETLRDFDYETVEAKGRFHGREGNGYLKIFGPTGSRQFEINVLDHRWKVDPTRVQAQGSPTAAPTPPSDDSP